MFWSSSRRLVRAKHLQLSRLRARLKTSSARTFNRGDARSVTVDQSQAIFSRLPSLSIRNTIRVDTICFRRQFENRREFFKTRPSISGIGAPLVAVGRVENPRFRQQFKLRRVYAPVTAVIKFSDQRAELEFVDPMKTERVAIGKRTFPLAVDLNAPTAMLIARERPERLGFAA
jgi:hypothetical protein